MKTKKFSKQPPANEKARDLLLKYATPEDAQVQVKQILCFIEVDDSKERNYWTQVETLLHDFNLIAEVYQQKQNSKW